MPKENETGSLGPLQRQVLNFIWDNEGCTVRQCLEGISAENRKEYAYTTIQTIFDVLYRKKLVARRRRKNAYHYSAKQSRAGMMAERLKDLFKRFTSSPQPVASSLVDALEHSDPSELDSLVEELKSRGYID